MTSERSPIDAARTGAHGRKQSPHGAGPVRDTDVLRDTTRTRRGFLIVVAIALLVRAVYLAQARAVPVFDQLMMDGAVYDMWARGIAAGDWMGRDVFYQAPLYPYLLAVLKALAGDGLWPIRIIQTALGALSCGLLFLTGAKLFGRRAGWIAGLLLAFYPPAIFFDGLVQKASLGGFIVALLLWLATRASRSPTSMRWFGCGAALGLLMLTREETLLLAPVIGAWILVHFRDRSWRLRGTWAAAYVGGAALILLPVAGRNALVGGEFVLTTSQAGSNFYIGNHAGANGTYSPLRPGRSSTPLERIDARELAELDAGRKLSASEVSNYWFSRSFAWIREHPGEWAGLLLRKLTLLFNAHEIADSEDQAYYAEHVPLLRWLAWILNLGVVLPLGAAGICLTWRNRGEARLLLLMLSTLCVGVVTFYVFARYRYPVVPIVILFAAAGAVRGHEAIRARTLGLLVGPGIALILTAVVAHLPGLEARAQLAMAYSNAGAVLLDNGRAREAEEQFRRSLELDDDPDSWSNLGQALVQERRLPEALECIHRALAVRPRDPRFLRDLGSALHETGDTAGAIEALRRSTREWPRDPTNWTLLGSLLAEQNAWPQVVEVAREALAANPDDVSTALSLVWLLATVPNRGLRNPVEAIRIGEEFEQRTAGREFRVLDVLAAAYASAGRFKEATDKATLAARTAEAVGDSAFAAQIRQRADQYRRAEPLVK